MKTAIVAGRIIQNSFNEDFFAVPVALSRILLSVGYIPFFLGYEAGPVEKIVSELTPDLFVFTGGDSLGENILRDSFEYELLKQAELLETPVIGICRGMQLMASSKGSSLTATESHAGNRHKVFGKSEFIVKSFHNFSLDSCPSGFKLDYQASDGTVEAMSNNQLKWFGVMWHPEREEVESEGYQYLVEVLRNL